MEPNLMNDIALAELNYRRERIVRNFDRATVRREGGRRWHRRPSVQIVPPYGDARA